MNKKQTEAYIITAIACAVWLLFILIQYDRDMDKSEVILTSIMALTIILLIWFMIKVIEYNRNLSFCGNKNG